MISRWGTTLLWLLFTAGLAVTGYWLLFTTYMVYDDEGYVLRTLTDFSAHGGLYDRVYTQYGPSYYLLYDALHRIGGIEFTSTTGRFIALFNWIATALACSGITWRLTRSWPAALATLGTTYFHLWSTINEPGHPGSLIALLLALTAWAGLELILREKLGWFALLTGASAAVIALIKINVGVFVVAATVAWLLIHHRPGRFVRTGTFAAGLALALLPPLLMQHFIHEEWAFNFAVVASVAAAAMLLAAAQTHRPAVESRHLAWFVGAGIGTTMLVAGLVLARGTSFTGLLEGIALGPLRHPGVYNFAPQWRPGTLPAALASLLLAFACWRGRYLPWLPTALAVTRLALGALLLASAAGLVSINILALVFVFLVPAAWVFVLPLPAGPSSPRAAGVAWVGLLLTEQYLHAYPIAGSQISWGTFLLIPLAAAGTWEAVVYLTRAARPWLSFIRFAGGAVAVAATLALSGDLAVLGRTRYDDSQPLDLPGAGDLRLLEDQALNLRTMSVNATAHGDVLFSLPGLASFNQWTGLPTPTLANATHWFSLLSDPQQAEISHALDAAKRPVVIVQRGVLDFLHKGNIPTRGPLFDFLAARFTRAFTCDSYEFWVRRGRVIAPLNRAELLEAHAPAAGVARWRINAIVLLERPIVAAEIKWLTTPLRPMARFSAANARLTATPLRLDGSPGGPTIADAWGRPLPTLAQLTIDIPGELPSFARRYGVLVLLDAQGRRVGEAGFAE